MAHLNEELELSEPEGAGINDDELEGGVLLSPKSLGIGSAVMTKKVLDMLHGNEPAVGIHNAITTHLGTELGLLLGAAEGLDWPFADNVLLDDDE